MKNKKEIDLEKSEQGWNNWCESEAGVSTATYTTALRCLHGEANEEEYAALKGYWCSYDGDCRIVGPDMGPITIVGENALPVYNRAIGLC